MSDTVVSDSVVAPDTRDQPAAMLPRAFAARPRRGDRLPIDSWSSWLSPWFYALAAPWRTRRAKRRARVAARIAARLETLTDAAFDERRRAAAARLRRRGLSGEDLVEGLAVAAEACRRTLGLSPYRGQLAAAAGLAAGDVVEMATGEGKTIAAFLAAATCGLAGRHVHVVTANDYLAARDHALLEPALTRLGLRSAVIVEATTMPQRRIAYRSDVAFLSSKEVAFDYLRDGLVRGGDTQDIAAKLTRVLGEPAGGRVLQPVLDVAIIDEIDSVLIDEAGTPLIISANDDADAGQDTIAEALAIAADMVPQRDYHLRSQAILPDLTREGVAKLERLVSGEKGPWAVRMRREEMLRAAIAALDSLRRDRDYLVRDGKVVIIDPHSGRTMADRQWGHDLHAMVEGKEGLQPSGRRKALASISFQRFFRNYQHLAGMSGTVREVASELAAIYGLPMTRVPRRLPLRRKWVGRRVFGGRDRLWTAVGRDVVARHERGQPVMVAVKSVAESTRAAVELTRLGISHRLLSAAHDREEADIVVRAGQNGAVTVVTNMAGRGTDIKIGEGVEELGGLAVLICERHESRRVDRQLMGRCARQGDPGTVVEFLSCEDGLLVGLGGPWHHILRRGFGRLLFGGFAFRRAQTSIDRVGRRQRFDLVRRDEQLAKMLAFAGGLD